MMGLIQKLQKTNNSSLCLLALLATIFEPAKLAMLASDESISGRRLMKALAASKLLSC